MSLFLKYKYKKKFIGKKKTFYLIDFLFKTNYF